MHDFTVKLLQWFRDNGRELPWRETTDAYAIWLSEVILQQTQVKQGWSYWERFMRRWPTVEALAEATEDEVLREWQGLGYYSRARNLHFAARQIVSMGGFPNTLEGIRQLKGVGDYTAAAIASFAFGLPAAVVDGNVYRVLARHFGIDTPINTTEGKKVFAQLAQEMLPAPTKAQAPTNLPPKGEATGAAPPSVIASPFGGRFVGAFVGAYNQAIMDFGATLCTPQAPRCASCPLQETCVAFREGLVGQLPVKLKKLKVKERHLIYVYIRCNGMTAIHRRGPGDIWQGLWEPVLIDHLPLTIEHLPLTVEHLPLTIDHSHPDESSAQPNGQWSMVNGQCLKRGFRHVLTHQVLLADFYLMETDSWPDLPSDYIWIPEADIDRYALPRLVERLLEFL